LSAEKSSAGSIAKSWLLRGEVIAPPCLISCDLQGVFHRYALAAPFVDRLRQLDPAPGNP
jgi:hypothetical protein